MHNTNRAGRVSTLLLLLLAATCIAVFHLPASVQVGPPARYSFVCNVGSKVNNTTVITTGDAGCYISTGDASGTIYRIDTVGNAAALATCSITGDVWAKTGGTYPTSGDKISASSPMTITTAVSGLNGSTSGWTTAVASGTIWNVNVASVTGCVGATFEVFFR